MTTAQGSLLVVDDNEMNREILRRRLQRRGYSVAVTEDGTQALERIEKNSFDLILLDVLMPGMSGLEVLSVIRQTHPATRLPVIMATAQSETEDIVKALELGANDYVTKPFDFPVVAARVETHLSLKRAMDQIIELERERDYLRARELENAKQVQSKLFPQKTPSLKTLEYAGDCIQANSVGGDYYDLLDMGPGRLGLVLANVTGKGMSAALLMANLQANVRTQYRLAVEDLAQFLRLVNRSFYESSGPRHFATFFFGYYEEAPDRIRYANCGHNAPLLLRVGGAVERLPATTVPLGIFEEWRGSIRGVALAPGDTLLIFSDGVTETVNSEGLEFGEERLLEILKANRHLPVSSLLTAISTVVREFGGSEQRDDQTLLVARVR